MYTFDVNPLDANWYIYIGATSHRTSTQGTLLSYLILSKNDCIIVGNGQYIPIAGCGQTILPSPHVSLILNNFLHET